MHPTRLLTRTAAALAVTGGVVIGMAGLVSAHTPTVKAACSGLTITAKDYPGSGNHVRVIVDGGTTIDHDFASSFSALETWTAYENHAWHVVITSGDGVGNVDQSGTQAACQPPPPPGPPTTVPQSQCPGVLPPMWVPVGDEGECPAPTPTTVPVTTTSPCPDGTIHDVAIGSPDVCRGGGTTIPVPPPTEVATTAPAPECPPGETLLTFEDGSTKCDDGSYYAVSNAPAPIAPSGPAGPARLPATGSSSTVVIVASLGALLVGGVLLFAGRRGHA